jgi:hypothetical protein
MKEKTKFNQKVSFAPISIEEYVDLHLRSNPEDTREDVTARLRSALQDHHRGVRCSCGNPIWVIGSAVMGNACFTCITGEAVPYEDYEIDQAIESVGE